MNTTLKIRYGLIITTIIFSFAHVTKAQSQQYQPEVQIDENATIDEEMSEEEMLNGLCKTYAVQISEFEQTILQKEESLKAATGKQEARIKSDLILLRASLVEIKKEAKANCD